MKNRFNKFFTYAALAGLLGFSVSCSNDDSIDDQTGGETENPTTEDSRWFTVAGAIMDETREMAMAGPFYIPFQKKMHKILILKLTFSKVIRYVHSVRRDYNLQ
nr:hypothetical protein [Flavimarina sp. Hel_I_48]